MTEKRRYTYTVLRYVHDVMTGEFLNVGIVLHMPSLALLRVRTRKTIGRIKDVFPDLDREAFRAAVTSIDRAIGQLTGEAAIGSPPGRDEDAASFARRALPADDSALQWSPVGSGVTDDVDKTLDRLFARLVTHYDSTRAQLTLDPVPAKESDE